MKDNTKSILNIVLGLATIVTTLVGTAKTIEETGNSVKEECGKIKKL
ncbi:MAG: hypothetical protein PUD43_09555 [Clostridia bacterium]|nr:hypothetical protein [Clostridia bacterium]